MPIDREPTTDRPHLRLGAVAMLDALGFKGIWRDSRYGVDNVLRTLKAVKREVEAVTDRTLSNLEELAKEKEGRIRRFAEDTVVEHRFLSDSIIVAATTECDPDEEATPEAVNVLGGLRFHACRAAAAVSVVAAEADSPLAYRGAIHVGRFYLDPEENFLVGPAIDEVAPIAEAAEVALVWLTPRAAAIGHPTASAKAWFDAMTMTWHVPMKTGGPLTTFVVNPFGNCKAKSRRLVREGAMRSFGKPGADVSIARKAQNTERFLDAAERHIEALATTPPFPAQLKRDMYDGE